VKRLDANDVLYLTSHGKKIRGYIVEITEQCHSYLAREPS